MRIPFAFLVVFFITQPGYSQTFSQVNAILGRVIDARTLKPLPFATVYLNQTTIGTVTNDNGEFSLSNIPPGRYDLVVSYVGYQPYQSKVIVKAGPATIVSIRLTASTTNLTEIMVRSKKDKDWAALYEKFRRQFFGISPYTTECRILNPWVLDFVDDKGILTATASLPLEIENLGLGYTITCHLKEFTASARFYKINGTYRFTKAQTMDTTLRALWETRRDDAYLGSVRHFLKTMVADSLEQEGYKLFDDLSKMPDEVVRNSSFIANLTAHTLQPFADTTAVTHTNTEGQYNIRLPWRVEVHYLGDAAPPKIYRSAPYAVSWIEVAEGSIEVNTDGTVINPDRMVVFGAMGDPRVAELLPIDFKLSENGVKAMKKKKVHSKLAALLEKPYVMTDKPYYYPAEAIMFKTFFNYVSPIYRDSLSHVMNVELIDQSGKVVQKKMFPVLGGMAVGDFTLPATTPPGDYTLRTYTRWMLNFDKQLISSKAIKVLPADQLGKVNDVPPQTKQLTIVTGKDEFETREQISLVLEAVNFYGNPVAADLAVVSTKGMQECLVEVDGVVLNSVEADGSVAETLASMSVQDVESVDVLRFGMGAAYGARSANGVIIIRTRMGEKTPARRKIDPSKLQAVKLPGYSTTEEFVSPDYSAHTSGDDRLDLRSTIYWNPFVITSIEEPIKVSFFAADVPTRYRIVVEGVTADGEAVRGEKIIVVRSKK